MMSRQQLNFLFLNIGHFLDHLFILIFATVAALKLTTEWNMSYAELIPYATPGFVAFGLMSVPAGWLADKWSREGMMVVFFIGIGIASILTSYASTPVEMGIGLAAVGLFAAIYHPVGLAMVVHGRTKTGVPLAINGIFGNMGVASAALLTGLMIDTAGWNAAFVVPGIVSIVVGVAYWWFVVATRTAREADDQAAAKKAAGAIELERRDLVRLDQLAHRQPGLGLLEPVVGRVVEGLLHHMLAGCVHPAGCNAVAADQVGPVGVGRVPGQRRQPAFRCRIG